jgi:DNA invertase Pin-like site-specific DNA recombinase
MNKITPEHLARDAYAYIRQSTADQLANNPESRRRQYALKVRAEALGWQNVVVIDDDLGRSGGGVARKGFERLLVAIGNGSAGAVLAIEASRLARNGRDRHTLLEFCGLVGCLLIDEDGVMLAPMRSAARHRKSASRRDAKWSRPAFPVVKRNGAF